MDILTGTGQPHAFVCQSWDRNPCTWHKSCCPKWERSVLYGLISTCQRTPELAGLSLSAHVTLSSDQLLDHMLVKWAMGSFYCMRILDLDLFKSMSRRKKKKSIYLPTHQLLIVNLPSAFKLSFTHQSKTHIIQAQDWTLLCRGSNGNRVPCTGAPQPNFYGVCKILRIKWILNVDLKKCFTWGPLPWRGKWKGGWGLGSIAATIQDEKTKIQEDINKMALEDDPLYTQDQVR